MSQIPPPPPPPISPPSPAPYGMPPQPAPGRTNVPAVVSLVCGLLACIPYVTGLAAIVIGIIGVRRAGRPEVGSGRGLAIAGIVLGVLHLGVWTLAGGSVLAFVGSTAPQRELARTFIQNLSTGTLDAATAQTDGSIAAGEIAELSETVQSWGALTDVTTTSINVDYTAGRTELGGTAKFPNNDKLFRMVLVKTGDGGWRVSAIRFD